MKKFIITLTILLIGSGSFASTTNQNMNTISPVMLNSMQNTGASTNNINPNIININRKSPIHGASMLEPYKMNTHNSLNERTFENMYMDRSQNAFENNYQTFAANSKKPELSQVEKLFNGKEADATVTPLRQVGYDIFNSFSSTDSNTTGKFNDDYKLSVGEKVSINLYGDSVDVMALSGVHLLSPIVQTEVDSKGDIFIQGVGVIHAEDKTIREVENQINTMASRKYNNLKARINVMSGSGFSVFVYGQVNKPGKVLISNNSSFIDALSAAGGVKKSGTLRKIAYTSGKKTINVDLYKTLFSDENDNIILKPNDRIFVGGIGSVVALKNGVSVSGIYELKEGETLQKLVSMAGGLLPGTQTTEVTLTRLNTETLERTAENISWTEANHSKLQSGDIIEFRDLYNVAENTVVLQGNIKHPATFAYKPNMRLSDILKNKKELLEETFTTQAVIRRISDEDGSIQTIPVYLKEFFAGMNDPLLKPRDIINIYKNTNAEFVDVYGCINIPKHITYTEDMRLDDVLTDIQFVESNIDIEDNNEKNISFTDKSGDAALVGGTSNNNRVISAENVAVEITGLDGSTQLYYLYDIMINGDTIKSIHLAPYDKIFFRTLRDNETIKNVKVSGFVKTPATFRFVDGKRLTDMIEMAGGLTKDADLRGIVYTRKNLQARQVNLAQKNNEKDIKLLEGRIAGGFKQASSDIEAKTNMIGMLKQDQKEFKNKYTGQIALNIKNNNLSKIKDSDNIEVQDGDEIYIPRMTNHVSVIGEVYNEQSFMFQKGSNVKTYIKEVGGYTPNAAKFRLYRVGVNGRAERVHSWTRIAQGDTIVVPRKIAGNDWITPVCDTLRGVASILSTAFVVTRW